jgi:hypothetical protein
MNSTSEFQVFFGGGGGGAGTKTEHWGDQDPLTIIVYSVTPLLYLKVYTSLKVPFLQKVVCIIQKTNFCNLNINDPYYVLRTNNYLCYSLLIFTWLEFLGVDKHTGIRCGYIILI